MAVNFEPDDKLNSFIQELGTIGQKGAFQVNPKLPKPKPQATLQPFEGLPAGFGAGKGVTGGIGASGPLPGGSLGQLMRAIRGQESGGRYNATNPSGASGAYQILRSNFEARGSGWDREALGRDVTYSQFMNSPQIQDAIARYKLGQYMKTRGMAGAAATWYGGDWGYRNMHSRRPQNGYPSMYAYVQAILRRAR